MTIHHLPQSMMGLGKATTGNTPKTSTTQIMAKNTESPLLIGNNGVLSSDSMTAGDSKHETNIMGKTYSVSVSANEY